MRKTYKIITASVVAASLFSGAMQMMNPDDRYNPNSSSYGRLLAEKYDQLASLEGSQGTYEHNMFFKDKSKQVGNAHNPRPMTLKGLSNTHAHSAELMDMRRTLERAMVGYEMRYAPAEVAGMQASFECRLKNVDINARLDKQCKENFERFFAEATRISEAQRGQEIYNAAQEMEQPATPAISYEQPTPQVMEQPEPIVTPAPAPVPQAPAFVPVPVDDNLLMREQNKQVSRPQPVPVKKAIPQAIAPSKAVAVKPVVAPVVPVKPRASSPVTTQDDNFDPLDYVHPRLREKMRQEQRAKQPNNILPKPSENPIDNNYKEKLPAPSIEGTITPPPSEPEEGFGIKPLSTAKPPVKPTAEAKFYNMTMNDAPAYTGGLPDAPVVKPNARFLEMVKMKTDKTATASTRSLSEGEKFVIPFNQGGTAINPEAQRNLDLVKSRLQNGYFSKVKIIGHSDSDGGHSVNKAVSLSRASAVYDVLGSTIAGARIGNMTIDGVGDSQPILSMNSTNDANRRVVIELLP